MTGHELVEMFRESEQLLAELQGGALELETLEPDGNGNSRLLPGSVRAHHPGILSVG